MLLLRGGPDARDGDGAGHELEGAVAVVAAAGAVGPVLRVAAEAVAAGAVVVVDGAEEHYLVEVAVWCSS